MGKVSLFIMLLCLLCFGRNIVESHIFARNQENLGSASLGDEVPLASSQGNLKPANLKDDGLTSLDVDPSFYMIMNGSDTAQRSNDKKSLQGDPGPGAMFMYVAGYKMDSQSYYGIEATIDVYGLSLDQDQQQQESGIMVSISNYGNNTESNIDGIIVGWHVYPGLYGDGHPHFFVYWTHDGYRETGCYNLKCPGYVPEAGALLVPGIAIDSVSEPGGVKHIIIFKVFKDSIGDWLVHCGFDSEPYLIGRFPKFLFTTLGDKADEIKLFGYAVTNTTHFIPMGSGYLSNSAKAASFSNIQLIDQNGQTSKVQQDLPTTVSDMSIYSVSPISPEGKFTYGGPSA